MADNENDDVPLDHANGWLALETVEQFLADDDWYPVAVDGTTAFRCGFNGNNGRFRVICHVNVELEQLYIYVVAECERTGGDSARCRRVLRQGELWHAHRGTSRSMSTTARVRYKSSLDFEGEQLTPRPHQQRDLPGGHHHRSIPPCAHAGCVRQRQCETGR